MITVYEDRDVADLAPLCDLRPAFDLRCGRHTILEKLRHRYPREQFSLWVRDELAAVTAAAHPDCRVNLPVTQGRLFLSARAVLHRTVPPTGRESVLLAGDEVVGFRICAECAVRLSSLAGLRADLAEEEVRATVVRRPWDLVELNRPELERELAGLRPRGRIERGAIAFGHRALAVGPGARVWPGAVISTEEGPVLLDAGAQVRPGSFVEGPCFVGARSVIDGARIRPGCSFGPECRIGGEVEASIFQGWANKHHDGFIGHSFVGEWVNLGAGTTNSDLKNAYQPVQVFFAGQPVDTGLVKVGCFFGDHAKTAIGSLFNTGTRIGTFASWIAPGLSPREVPAFARGDGRWSAADAIACARAVMARRGVTLSPAGERLLRARHRCA